jgi:class 3 adenylate cyclase
LARAIGDRPQHVAFLAGALTGAIFLVDTLSPLPFAVAVLYAVVVSLVSTRFRREEVVGTAVACCAATVLSFVLVHGLAASGSAVLRCAMSLGAIATTTFLALKNLTTHERLREIERERANLARFFSPELVDQLVAIDEPLSTARSQSAAVLFVDMVGFTAWCARLEPRAVIDMLRELLALLSASVFAHGGSIDKFMGDGLMAVFGAPNPSPADATNAARCALDILERIDGWNERSRRLADEAIRVAVGIHYGEVVQGDIGSDRRLEFTVVGDTVNVASRVEAYCRSLDALVLVTDAVVASLHAEGSTSLADGFVDQGFHPLRGRPDPIRLYGLTRSIGESALRV